jgi:hypothetical protein
MQDEMMLQDDLEEKEKRLYFITQPKTDVLPY